jgi:hypothetical protein
MKGLLLLSMLSGIGVCDSFGQKSNSSSAKDQRIIKKKRLMDYKLKLVLPPLGYNCHGEVLS